MDELSIVLDLNGHRQEGGRVGVPLGASAVRARGGRPR